MVGRYVQRCRRHPRLARWDVHVDDGTLVWRNLSGPKEAFQSFGTVLSGIASTIETINSGIDAMKSVDKASDSWFGGIDSMNENLYGDKKYGLLTGWTKPIVDMFSGDDGSHASVSRMSRKTTTGRTCTKASAS